MAPELSIVIPVFGCARQLNELYERLLAALGPLTDDFELVLVDDASPDSAWPRLVALAESDPRVRVFGLSRNFGQDAAITAGLAPAAGAGGVGMGSGLLARRAVDAFNRMQDRDREYHLMLDWLGFDSAVVPIAFVPRADESSYTVRKLIRVALDGMFFRTTVLLRVVVFVGFVVAVVGAGLAIFNIFYYFIAGQPTGYTSLIVLLVLFSGLIIVSVGVVGLYVGRIFEQVKSRPLFVIARQIDRAEGSAAEEPGVPSGSAELPGWPTRE